MPGVPSGRGCDACRRQKKKCDLGQPQCGRCTRLKIPCIGSGERRYKFKPSSFQVHLSKPSPSSSSSSSSSNTSSSSSLTTPSPRRSPLIGTTTVGSAFISQLQIDDIRFDINYFGSFLKDIPKRLGVNPALDAAVKALTVTYPILHTRRQTPGMLAAFGGALRGLRTTLDDPGRAMSAETLCAIYLIMVTQAWMGGPDDACGSHERMVAHILSYVPVESDVWSHPFGRDLLTTMCIPVIYQGMLDPEIKIGPWFHRLIEKITPPCPPGETPSPLTLQSLAYLPYYLRQPENHRPEIRTTYDAMLSEYTKLRRALDVLTAQLDATPKPKLNVAMKTHAAVQAACGFLIQASMTLNGILRAFNPNDLVLIREISWFTDDMLKLAREASRYRPVGAGYVVVCLITAWATAEDAGKREEVWGVLGEYAGDMPELDWFQRAVRMREGFQGMRYRLALAQMEGNAEIDELF